MDHPYVYDKAKWHRESVEVAGLPDGQEFVHTGFYLGWLADNGLLDPEFMDDNDGASVQQFRNHKLTGPQLYMRWDGALIDYMLCEEGNAFSKEYFDFDRGFFLDDYTNTFNVSGGNDIFGVEDNWKNYEKIAACIDRAFEKWRRRKDKKPWQFWK